MDRAAKFAIGAGISLVFLLIVYSFSVWTPSYLEAVASNALGGLAGAFIGVYLAQMLADDRRMAAEKKSADELSARREDFRLTLTDDVLENVKYARAGAKVIRDDRIIIHTDLSIVCWNAIGPRYAQLDPPGKDLKRFSDFYDIVTKVLSLIGYLREFDRQLRLNQYHWDVKPITNAFNAAAETLSSGFQGIEKEGVAILKEHGTQAQQQTIGEATIPDWKAPEKPGFFAALFSKFATKSAARGAPKAE